MEIKFVRHAEKENVGEDPLLTKKGVKQAKHLAERLKGEKFDEFYCSDMARAKQTAEFISKKINLPFKIEKVLNEFKSELINKPKKDWNNKEKEHYNRLIVFLKKFSKNSNEPKSVLIVAHGITNRVLLSYFFGLDLKNTPAFLQTEGGINSIYWGPRFNGWRLVSWNDHSHIPKKLRI
jgi:broad specificity phosphatase PhoE